MPDLTPRCDRTNIPRGSLVGIPCGRPAVTHILGVSDARAFMFDRCQRHRNETVRHIERQPGGRVVREVDA